MFTLKKQNQVSLLGELFKMTNAKSSLNNKLSISELWEIFPPNDEVIKSVYDFLKSEEPIKTKSFTFYPMNRILINDHGRKELTNTHSKIFKILAQAHKLKKMVPREILHKILFPDNPYLTTAVIPTHIHNINKHLVTLQLKISNIHSFGYFIEDVKVKS
jgi:DNA-binding response OmpR family regulator